MSNNISKNSLEFNFTRIHFGLGKTQQKIMDILEEERTGWAIMDNDSLTSKVYYPDLRGVKLWKGKDYPVTRSQLNTVRKSVKALERRGLVKTEVIFFMSNNGARYGKGVSIVTKHFGLSEEAKPKNPFFREMLKYNEGDFKEIEDIGKQIRSFLDKTNNQLAEVNAGFFLVIKAKMHSFEFGEWPTDDLGSIAGQFMAEQEALGIDVEGCTDALTELNYREQREKSKK